ncbi:hypothetical protein J437_LFUL005532 [Ladona fulva]|uniref:Uncharacterized protein n=1 Tax=Ladona fulva TaxID=123851 RepID=A0A8K0NW48_LADFU|nr:hypothetical protein J437_LFUL005532 [Ladona fulva]
MVGLLAPIPVVLTPFATLEIDYVGLFPATDQGNLYIMLHIGGCCWAETRAVPDTVGLSVKLFLLEQVVLRHGTPQKIISFWGTGFTM